MSSQQVSIKYFGQLQAVETKYEKEARFNDWLRDLDIEEKLYIPIEDIKEVWLRYDEIMS